MELLYQLEEADGYLAAHVTGEWHLNPVYRLIDALVGECRARNFDCLLVDCLDVEISGMVLEYERYLVGGRLAEKLGTLRLAALFPAEQINKFAESVAVGAGAQVLVTADREEALRWLAQGAPSGSGRNDG